MILQIRGSSQCSDDRSRARSGNLLGKAMLALCVAAFASCGGGGSSPAPIVSTQVAPSVTLQPVAASVTVGNTATFTAAASGTPAPSVQWQQSVDGGTTWTDIAGATSTTNTTPAAAASDNAKSLRAVFSNSAGTVTSNAVVLTVTPAGPVIVGLNGPTGVTVDTNGNLYIADAFNHVVRKVTPSGVASVLAGQPGTPGRVDANGGAARFNVPSALAVDTAGTVYVADQGNCLIRKIAPNGDVSTLAGSFPVCSPGLNGTGTAASFMFPTGVALDIFGNVFVTENDAHDIRMIRPTGEVSTLAGSASVQGGADGFGSVASFFLPAAIAIDTAGNLYVADQTVVRFVTSNGEATHIAGLDSVGGSADGAGSGARFHQPQGIAVNAAGHIFVVDTQNFTIREITNGDVVSTIAGAVNSGGATDGPCLSARFNRPQGAAFDAAGNLYIADTDNNSIRKITPPPCVVSTIVR